MNETNEQEIQTPEMQETNPETPKAKLIIKRKAKKPAEKKPLKRTNMRGFEDLQKTRRKPGKRGPQGRPEEERIRNGSKKFGAALRKKRLELGWTQRQMGEILGIKQPHMSNLEKGTFKPGAKLLAIIERKFFKHVGLKKPRKGAPKS
jgi:DNA-binding XRE family transcriptional regulator